MRCPLRRLHPSDATAVAPIPAPDAVPAARDLPPVDALTFESDFAAFLKPEVDPATQRAALKKLFSDPRFNVMDGLDTYIDDYTLADPMPAGMLDKLANVYAMLTKDAQASDAQSVSAEEDHPAPAATGDPQAIEAAPPAADVPAPAPPVAVAASEERSPDDTPRRRVPPIPPSADAGETTTAVGIPAPTAHADNPHDDRRQDALRLQLQSHDAARRRGARPRARAAVGAESAHDAVPARAGPVRGGRDRRSARRVHAGAAVAGRRRRGGRPRADRSAS